MKDNIDSATSYSIAGGSYFMAKLYEHNLADYAAAAHDIAMIVACGIVIIRFIYDGIRLVRYIKNGRGK